MRNWAKMFLVIGTVLVIAATGFGALIYVNAGDPSDVESLTFTGTTWQGKMNDAIFVATILENDIEVQWNDGADTNALYWKGTFTTPVSTHLGDMFVVTSVGDTKAMSNSLLGSQDSTKDFLYEDRKLSFKMTVLGVTQTIHLEKQNPGV